MWRTFYGNRVLQGAEAKLFAEALLNLLDRARTDQLYDYNVGLPCFDGQAYGQKISVLFTIGNGLLREDVPVIPLTAVLEGGIAAVFWHLRNLITFEMDGPDMGTAWRQMIVAARRHTGGEQIPEPTCEDPKEWDFQVQELKERVLWSADYEFDDLFMDGPPEVTRAFRRDMLIDDNYFAAITEDLTDQQAGDRVAELRGVCAGVVGR